MSPLRAALALSLSLPSPDSFVDLPRHATTMRLFTRAFRLAADGPESMNPPSLDSPFLALASSLSLSPSLTRRGGHPQGEIRVQGAHVEAG